MKIESKRPDRIINFDEVYTQKKLLYVGVNFTAWKMDVFRKRYCV